VLPGDFEGETLVRIAIKNDFSMTNYFGEKKIVARVV